MRHAAAALPSWVSGGPAPRTSFKGRCAMELIVILILIVAVLGVCGVGAAIFFLMLTRQSKEQKEGEEK
jgi:flagellar basal body-associated protein FliL